MKLRPLLLLLAAFVLTVIALAFWRAHLPPVGGPPPRPPPPLVLSFAQTTPAAKVELTIDPAIARYPALTQRLYRDGVGDLKGFAAQAADDQARLTAKGLPARPYQRSIVWSLTAATARIVSVKQAWFDDTGGAHPNHGAKGLLWNETAGREIARDELLRAGADPAQLDQLLCQAIRAEKTHRQGTVFDLRTWPCPRWADADFVLAPSNVLGKAGGLVFLFDPYSIGPYVEGDWAIVVPQAEFRAELAPVWAGEFAGAPAG